MDSNLARLIDNFSSLLRKSINIFKDTLYKGFYDLTGVPFRVKNVKLICEIWERVYEEICSSPRFLSEQFIIYSFVPTFIWLMYDSPIPIKGFCILSLSQESLKLFLSNIFTKHGISVEEVEVEDFIKEVGNIVIGAFLNTISKSTRSKVLYNVPELIIAPLPAVIESVLPSFAFNTVKGIGVQIEITSEDGVEFSLISILCLEELKENR